MNKQTSDEMSALAARYVRMRNAVMFAIVTDTEDWQAREQFFKDIRKLAASVLSQDTTKGPRKRRAVKK